MILLSACHPPQVLLSVSSVCRTPVSLCTFVPCVSVMTTSPPILLGCQFYIAEWFCNYFFDRGKFLALFGLDGASFSMGAKGPKVLCP